MVRGFTTIFPRSRGYPRRVKRTYTRHSGYCCRPRMDWVTTQNYLVVDQMQGTVHFTCIGMPCISPKSTLLTTFAAGKRAIPSNPDDVRDTWTTIVYPKYSLPRARLSTTTTTGMACISETINNRFIPPITPLGLVWSRFRPPAQNTSQRGRNGVLDICLDKP